MPRLMSVQLTEQAVLDRRKTVTRRAGWWRTQQGRRLLVPGDHLTLCRKVMGRKADEPLIRLCDVEVVSVRRELLSAVDDLDVHREGFQPADLEAYLTGPLVPGAMAAAFCRFFVHHMGGSHDQEVTRIVWRYL